jgi:hypothetical protein
MTEKTTFSAMFSDEQMRAYLEANSSLVFDGATTNWQQIERQVERLGFGNKYFVSQAMGLRGELTKVIPVRQWVADSPRTVGV